MNLWPCTITYGSLSATEKFWDTKFRGSPKILHLSLLDCPTFYQEAKIQKYQFQRNNICDHNIESADLLSLDCIKYLQLSTCVSYTVYCNLVTFAHWTSPSLNLHDSTRCSKSLRQWRYRWLLCTLNLPPWIHIYETGMVCSKVVASMILNWTREIHELVTVKW
jgi:hypothetical protein